MSRCALTEEERAPCAAGGVGAFPSWASTR